MAHNCKRKIPFIKGRARCEKHNLVYHISWIKQPCPKCAKEQNICHKCGEKLDG